MRRKEKEIPDKQLIDDILNQANVLRLAMVDGDEPYIVSMNYAYTGDCLYMHCAKEGRKIDILKKNNKVAFQVDTGVELVVKEDACNCTTKYMSVFGKGKAFLSEENEEKKKALDAIMTKHTGREGFEYPERAFEKTLIIRVEIETMTGKKSGY